MFYRIFCINISSILVLTVKFLKRYKKKGFFHELLLLLHKIRTILIIHKFYGKNL